MKKRRGSEEEGEKAEEMRDDREREEKTERVWKRQNIRRIGIVKHSEEKKEDVKERKEEDVRRELKTRGRERGENEKGGKRNEN